MPNEQMRRFFAIQEDKFEKLTFNDVRLETQYSTVLPSETNLASRFSRRIILNIPIVSSPMDTVTESKMAIAMALQGGLGIIHAALTPEVQAREVARVKHRLHGQVFKPFTVKGDQDVSSVLEFKERKDLKFHTFPVVDDADRLVGLLSGNDFDFCADNSQKVRDVMTPLEMLTTAPEGTGQKEAYRLMREHKKKVLPLISAGGRLRGLYVFSDLNRILSGEKTPHNLDGNGRLVVGAAIGFDDDSLRRAELLAEEGCDVFVLDAAHGDTPRMHELVHTLKGRYPLVDVVPGNVSNGPAARRLVDMGADGIRVGQGPGSICTTRTIAGVGTPQVSAIYECAAMLTDTDVPVCADGGINNSGDIVIGLAVGASSVMLGRLLAGTDEAPGDMLVVDEKRLKSYRGMGSAAAMRDNASSRKRYGHTDAAKSVPEGVEGAVPYQGSVQSVLRMLTGGIRSGMGYQGARTIAELEDTAQIFRFTSEGLRESHPHDILLQSLLR